MYNGITTMIILIIKSDNRQGHFIMILNKVLLSPITSSNNGQCLSMMILIVNKIIDKVLLS